MTHWCPDCHWLWTLHKDGQCLEPAVPYVVEYKMKQDNFPIDEVDAQTLFMVIRELHARKNFGVLRSAYLQIEDLLRGDIQKWRDQRGDTPGDSQG
jgi:hypothetical protein